ncbi:hypothetical protein ACMX25_32230 [Caballeronia sp. 15715]|uniref:hypothetical protein n=1 Tax=Caballeronia sp. 15715 TaxID=3391030 RepID=UPI0039E24F98
MLSSSSYIDERAGIAFVHRNPIQKLTALDAERISFLDAVQQSPDKIKRYEARARRRIRASLDPLLLAFILNKNKNKNQSRNTRTQRFNGIGRLIAMHKQQRPRKRQQRIYSEDFLARLVR